MLTAILFWISWVSLAVLTAAFPRKYVRTTARAKAWAVILFGSALTGIFYLLTNNRPETLIFIGLATAIGVSVIAGSKLLSWRPESVKVP
jgi:hypothetical protein